MVENAVGVSCYFFAAEVLQVELCGFLEGVVGLIYCVEVIWNGKVTDFGRGVFNLPAKIIHIINNHKIGGVVDSEQSDYDNQEQNRK